MRDKYADEAATELDEALYLRWYAAHQRAQAANKEADKLRAELEEQLRGAHAGTVNGVKVVTRRPIDGKYRVNELRRQYPDLTNQFITPRTVEEFDVNRFGKSFPEILETFQAYQFRAIDLK